VLQSAADDFGHVVHKKPVAVLRPGDAQDIAKLVQFANREGLKVAMRGQGHSFFGQTQVEGGVVIDSSSLNAVRIVKSGTGGTAEIGPGSKWHPVLMAANAQKLTVSVIADTFLSVSTPVQAAVARLLRDGTAVRTAIHQRVRTNLSTAKRLMPQFPAGNLLPVEGGWSLLVRVPAARSEEQIVLDLLERERVLVHPGFFFDLPHEAFVVVSLLPESDVFADAFARLLRHVIS